MRMMSRTCESEAEDGREIAIRRTKNQNQKDQNISEKGGGGEKEETEGK